MISLVIQQHKNRFPFRIKNSFNQKCFQKKKNQMSSCMKFMFLTPIGLWIFRLKRFLKFKVVFSTKKNDAS